VTDAASVTDAITRHRPDVVVNCAAWTAVDDAEASEEQALAWSTPAARPTWPRRARPAGARMVQVSTDYVFAGDGVAPARMPRMTSRRRAPPTDAPSWPGSGPCSDRLPGSGYVVRTAWLYGAHGPNFVRTMIKLEDQRPAVDVVDDQHGQPTWTADVAEPDHRADPRRRPAGHLPRHQQRADHLVRAGPGDLRPARRRSGPGAAGTEQRAEPAGAAPGLQRARPRPELAAAELAAAAGTHDPRSRAACARQSA
jgi:hypothetical protein